LKRRDIYCSLAFLGILTVLYSCLSIHYYILTNKERFYRQEFFTSFDRSNPSILILGDSHAQNAIAANTLGPEYFSLAQGGDNIRQIFLKLDYAIRQKPGIRYLLIPLDYHTFSWHRYKNMNFDQDLDYTRNIRLIADLYDVAVASVFVRSLIHLLPLASADNWEKYFYLLTRANPNELISERNYDESTPFEKEVSARRRVKGHLGKQIVYDELVGVMDRLIAFCGSHNLKIIGIRYPLSAEYARYASHFDIGRIERIFQARRDHFFMILNYVDIFNGYPCYFLNADHLNPQGALIFTRILARDMEYALLHATRRWP
jgi:hypothetical protein